MRTLAVTLLLISIAHGTALGEGISAEAEMFRAALERLVSRTNPDAFLIISEADSGKFVQFSHHPDNGLAFDLPVDGLSDEEQMRASRHLIGEGAEFLSWQVDEHRMQAYSKRLGRDVEAALRLAIAVMRDVYGFPPGASYTLVEN